MGKTLIRNGTLIDGTGRDPILDAVILVEDNQIVEVGSEATVNLQDEQIIELDAQNGFILPGFIDAHVHLSMEGFDLQKMLLTPFSYNFYKSMDNFRRTIMAGVTCVRDAGGVDLGMKKAADEGIFLGPRVKISVGALSITSGHGDSWLPSGVDLNQFFAYPGMPDGRCDGSGEVRKKVREMLRKHKNLWCDLAFRNDHASGGKLDADWRVAFMEFPDRFMVGTDTYTAERWHYVVEHANWSRGWMGDLPRDIAERIAYRNGDAIFGDMLKP